MVQQKTWKCCICGEEFPVTYASDGTPLGIGQNNPDPVYPQLVGYEDDCVCCNDCNAIYVIPLREYRLHLGLTVRIGDGDERGQLVSSYD